MPAIASRASMSVIVGKADSARTSSFRPSLTRSSHAACRARQQGTRSGKPIGRPKVGDAKERAIRAELAKGTGILKTARKLGVGTGTVQRIINAA
jgi:DNA invertase Pin-like site-specific DNA recombinase